MGGNSTLRTPGFGQKRKKRPLILMPTFTLKGDVDRRLMRGRIGYLPPVRARRDKNTARGVASAAPPLADYPNYLRYQQRRKKSFYRFSIIYRLGIGRHMGLGFESISAFGAGPKIEDNPLAHVFPPFGDK
jgi:hypothetical protein